MSGQVFGAYLNDGRTVHRSFMNSLNALMVNSEDLLWERTMVGKTAGAGGLAGARNEVTAHWLDQTSAEWLWFIDSDMGFEADTLDRLYGVAKHHGIPALGALCFTSRLGEADGMGGYRPNIFPTLYGWDGAGFKISANVPKDKLIRVSATGAACLLLHRKAMEQIRSAHGDEWWTPVRYAPEAGGQLLGEDLSLCYRLMEGGHPLFVDTSIKTTHAKTLWIGEEIFEAFQEYGRKS